MTILALTQPAVRRLGRALAVFTGIGTALVAMQVWTYVAWLRDDGLHQVTQFRDHDSASWYAARIFEGVVVVLAIVMATIVVRQVRRERRFTLDAKYVVACSLLYWMDPLINFFQPIWMYSSNFVNVQNWCGHVPGVVNQDCGRLPHPILFIGLLYAFGMLALAMIGCWFARRVQDRWPHLSRAQLFGVIFLAAMALDLLIEIPMVLLRLWAFPGSPDLFSIFASSGRKYPLVELIGVALFLAVLIAVRFFKDDRGRAVVEQQDHTRGAASSILAMVGVFGVAFVLGSTPAWIMGHFSARYREMPPHMVNDLCDAPGTTGTAYGDCPGG